MQLRWLAIVMVSAALLGACGDDDSSSDAGMDAGRSQAGTPATDSAVPLPMVECKEMPKCVAEPPDLAGFLGEENKELAALAASFGDISSFITSGPCCTDDGACGVNSDMLTGGMCVEQDQEGKPDATCSDFMFDIGSVLAGSGMADLLGAVKVNPVNLKGCCRPDNKCGLELGGLGVGCVERTAASELVASGASMVDAGGVDAGLVELEAMGCEYEPSTGTDAGSEDAGN
jgi:hypothetical protein